MMRSQYWIFTSFNELFLENHKTIMEELLSKEEMYIVSSLSTEKTFYLFNRNIEKEIKTDDNNYIKNSCILNSQEKIFVKFFGLLVD